MKVYDNNGNTLMKTTSNINIQNAIENINSSLEILRYIDTNDNDTNMRLDNICHELDTIMTDIIYNELGG
jgi:hypothetical protein